jgi:MFS transporter, CP family, cyanate transporter
VSILPSRDLRLLALIAAVGFQLRAVVLAVPPVLPAIRDDLHLSFTAAGALTALPVLCLGAAAIPGALLVSRFGARRVVGLGVIGGGVAALLRLVPPEPAELYVFTALMALCLAAAQPAMVAVVRGWFPAAVQRASTVLTAALSLGGLAGASLTVHLLGPGGWRGSFVIWALPALAAGALWLTAAPGRGDAHQPEPAGLGRLMRDRAVWHVAAMFGIQSLVYYGSSSWIPFELRAAGPGQLSVTMFALNIVTVPLALGLATLRWPWARSRLFYALAGALMAAGATGFVLELTGQAWAWALLLGLGTGMCFTGANALPALFARTDAEVPGYAALVLTAGYAISFAGPLLGGVLLDQTGRPGSPFWVMAAAALLLVALGLTLPSRAVPVTGEERRPEPRASPGRPRTSSRDRARRTETRSDAP